MSRFSIKAIGWKFKTASIKSWIKLQDRYGWFSYNDWIREIESNVISSSSGQSNVESSEQILCFTILIPYRAGDDDPLSRTIASLARQSYPNWKALLLLDQSSESSLISGNIDLSDERIISPVLQINSAGKIPYRDVLVDERLSDGYICRLLPGDTLSPNSLAKFADTINVNAKIDILYADEDQLNEDGTIRENPQFYPDWSPEYLFSSNYLIRAFFHSQLLSEVTNLSTEEEVYEDLVYRCAENAENIYHVPIVAIHTGRTRKLIPGSPAAEKHLRSVRNHAIRIGIHDNPQVFYPGEGISQLTWRVVEKEVAIIIPTRDRPEYLRRCLKSLLNTTNYSKYTITLVDSGSRDPETLSYYKEIENNSQIKIIEVPGEFNFSAALNCGAKHTHEEIIIFLNNDIEVIEPSWLEEMVRWSSIPEIGIVGSKLLYPDGKIQHAGIIMGMEGHASHIFGGAEDGAIGAFGSVNWYRNYSAVTAACMAMRREVYQKIGGFNEDYKLVFNDVELCLRTTEAGYRVVYTPFAQMIHHEGGTRGHYIPSEDIRLGFVHMKDIVAQGDPCYNPNLSLAVRIPTLKRPFEESSTERLRMISKYS